MLIRVNTRFNESYFHHNFYFTIKLENNYLPININGRLRKLDVLVNRLF